jgi:hypothetical protein
MGFSLGNVFGSGGLVSSISSTLLGDPSGEGAQEAQTA